MNVPVLHSAVPAVHSADSAAHVWTSHLQRLSSLRLHKPGLLRDRHSRCYPLQILRPDTSLRISISLSSETVHEVVRTFTGLADLHFPAVFHAARQVLFVFFVEQVCEGTLVIHTGVLFVSVSGGVLCISAGSIRPRYLRGGRAGSAVERLFFAGACAPPFPAI